MKKYLLTFEDAFSGATTQKETAIDESYLQKMQNRIESREIVYSQLENGIRWNWILKSSRKPVSDKKVQVSLYIRQSEIEKFGDVEKLKDAIYEFVALRSQNGA